MCINYVSENLESVYWQTVGLYLHATIFLCDCHFEECREWSMTRVQRVFLQHFNNCKSWTFCSIQTIICQNDKRRKLYHVDRPLLLWITEAVPSLGRFYQPRTANNEVNNSILALTRNCGHMTMNRILHAYFMTSKKL